MARARGANATMAAVFESTYGTPPGAGFYKMPFVSSNLGEEQGLIASDLLGEGRSPQDPTLDVANNMGDLVVPVDLRYIGFWLKLMYGAPTSAGTAAAVGTWTFTAQPAVSSTITAYGTVFTFVSGAPSGNQIQIGANLAATLTAAAVALNASVVANVALATYSATGTVLTATLDAMGGAGNAYTLAASATSNATVSGATATGGVSTHTFIDGVQTLPSMSIEVGLPEVPSFGMNFGAKLDKLHIPMSRGGLLNATLSLVAQGEALATTTQAGTPSSYPITRFAQAKGEVQRDGVDIAGVTAADFTAMNNLDKVETIRPDSRIENADAGTYSHTGQVTIRFDSTALLDLATNGTPCVIKKLWAIGSNQSLSVTAHRVFLPKAKRPVTGPGGVQATFAYQAAMDPTLNKAVTVVLTNDVAGY